jgi:hypothetical protein
MLSILIFGVATLCGNVAAVPYAAAAAPGFAAVNQPVHCSSPLEQFELFGAAPGGLFGALGWGSAAEAALPPVLLLAALVALTLAAPRLVGGGWLRRVGTAAVRAAGSYPVANGTRAQLPQLPLLLTLTLALATYNLSGLLPYGCAFSAHLVCTLFYAATGLFGRNCAAAVRYGRSRYHFFLAAGLPLPLLPVPASELAVQNLGGPLLHSPQPFGGALPPGGAPEVSPLGFMAGLGSAVPVAVMLWAGALLAALAALAALGLRAPGWGSAASGTGAVARWGHLRGRRRESRGSLSRRRWGAGLLGAAFGAAAVPTAAAGTPRSLDCGLPRGVTWEALAGAQKPQAPPSPGAKAEVLAAELWEGYGQHFGTPGKSSPELVLQLRPIQQGLALRHFGQGWPPTGSAAGPSGGEPFLSLAATALRQLAAAVAQGPQRLLQAAGAGLRSHTPGVTRVLAEGTAADPRLALLLGLTALVVLGAVLLQGFGAPRPYRPAPPTTAAAGAGGGGAAAAAGAGREQDSPPPRQDHWPWGRPMGLALWALLALDSPPAAGSVAGGPVPVSAELELFGDRCPSPAPAASPDGRSASPAAGRFSPASSAGSSPARSCASVGDSAGGYGAALERSWEDGSLPPGGVGDEGLFLLVLEPAELWAELQRSPAEALALLPAEELESAHLLAYRAPGSRRVGPLQWPALLGRNPSLLPADAEGDWGRALAELHRRGCGYRQLLAAAVAPDSQLEPVIRTAYPGVAERLLRQQQLTLRSQRVLPAELRQGRRFGLEPGGTVAETLAGAHWLFPRLTADGAALELQLMAVGTVEEEAGVWPQLPAAVEDGDPYGDTYPWDPAPRPAAGPPAPPTADAPKAPAAPRRGGVRLWAELPPGAVLVESKTLAPPAGSGSQPDPAPGLSPAPFGPSANAPTAPSAPASAPAAEKGRPLRFRLAPGSKKPPALQQRPQQPRSQPPAAEQPASLEDLRRWQAWQRTHGGSRSGGASAPSIPSAAPAFAAFGAFGDSSASSGSGSGAEEDSEDEAKGGGGFSGPSAAGGGLAEAAVGGRGPSGCQLGWKPPVGLRWPPRGHLCHRLAGCWGGVR